VFGSGLLREKVRGISLLTPSPPDPLSPKGARGRKKFFAEHIPQRIRILNASASSTHPRFSLFIRCPHNRYKRPANHTSECIFSPSLLRFLNLA